MATLVTVGSGDIRENVILNVSFPQTLQGALSCSAPTCLLIPFQVQTHSDAM